MIDSITIEVNSTSDPNLADRPLLPALGLADPGGEDPTSGPRREEVRPVVRSAKLLKIAERRLARAQARNGGRNPKRLETAERRLARAQARHAKILARLREGAERRLARLQARGGGRNPEQVDLAERRVANAQAREAEHAARTLGVTAGALAGELAREGVSTDTLASEVSELSAELSEALDFILPQSVDLPGLLETMADLLLTPPRLPGEPCLAPAPLLRDLLDIALGKLKGVLGETVTKATDFVRDLILPAFAEGEELAGFIESVLDDPITAALNLILGQRAKIDCVVEGGLGVGIEVINTAIDRLVEKLMGILP